MKSDTQIGARGNRARVCGLGGLTALAATAALLLAPAESGAAGGASIKSNAVKFEKVEGSDAERVILTEKAAQRIGIEIGEVTEAPIVRRQMVGGLVIPPLEALPAPDATGGGSFGGFEEISVAPVPKPGEGDLATIPKGEAWVLVTLSEAEWGRLAKDKPARVLPLVSSDVMEADAAKASVLAQPAGFPPIEDVKRSMLTLYYVVADKVGGIKLNTRVRVELQQTGDGEVRKVVPYSAIYYDSKGTPWLYIAREPLAYQREKVDVDHIAGSLAVLKQGPEVGTQVVTTGAALLYGAEVYFRN